MSRINNEDINKVRQSIDIADVISEYIPVEKKGRNFVALCPFHDDNNPSLSISQDKQIYKCFVCGAGGNVFTFVQEYAKVSFIEAVKIIADKTDIKLDINVASQAPIDPRINHLHEIMKEAEIYLNYQLNNTNNQHIIDYVKKRHLSHKEIDYFNIGYEEDHGLANFLKRKGYKLDDLIAINLLHASQYGESSVFNNRLIFPIHDRNGNTVAFSARSTSESDAAKYVNSNENEIYTKGDVIYNYHRAQLSARQNKEVFLVEGVMDVIAFYKADVENAVASLGTALTDNQARQIRSLAQHVVIAYDGDRAGAMATMKAIEILLSQNMSVEVLTSFGDLDPDDYLVKHHKEGFSEALKVRQTWMDFVISHSKNEFNLDNYLERKAFVNALLKYEHYIIDNFDKQYFRDRIMELTHFNSDQLQQLQPVKQPIVQIEKKQPLTEPKNRIEYGIIGQMLSGKQAAYEIRDNLGFLNEDLLYHIYLMILDYYSYNDEMVFADLLSHTDNERMQKVLIDIYDDEAISKEYNKKIIAQSISMIQVKLIEERIKELKHLKTDDILKKAEVASEIAKLQYEKEKLMLKHEEGKLD